MSTPTPRTCGEISCDECDARTAAITTERDQLRAELQKVYALVTPVGFDLPGGIFETAQAVTELRAERDQLRGALALGQQNCDDAYDDLRTERAAAIARAERAEAELAAERARMADLVADLNDACITLESAKNDCDDYAMQNTAFKLMAVSNVLLQYIPNAAMKGGAK